MKSIADLRVLIDRIPYAEGNLGEEAILGSLLQDLEACGVKDISILSTMPERTAQRHGRRVHVIPDRISRWLLLPSLVKKFDLIIWGGGHMLQDRSSKLYIPFVVRTLLLARLLGVPRFIYAPGLGPVVGKLGRFLSRIALQGSRVIVVRDQASADYLNEIGITDVHITADPAFSLRTDADDMTPGSPGEKPIVAFAPRRLFYRRGSFFPVSWQLAARKKHHPNYENYLKNGAASADYLFEEKGMKIQFFPLDIGPNPRDDLVCRSMRRYMAHGYHVRTFDDDPSLETSVQRLGQLDLLVSARLHGIILGLRFGLPFIGIDSDGKIKHLAESIGFGHYVMKDQEFRVDRFCELVKRVHEEGQELRERLRDQGRIMRERAENNRALLRDCLEKIAQES
jgi:polysaccharide pyruvyl transferase WcaK-like protein